MTRIVVYDAELQRALTDAAQRLERPRELLDRIGAALERNINLRFETKRDPAGAQWPELSDTTLAIYKSKWFTDRNPDYKGALPGSLLERTRHMRQALAYDSGDTWTEAGFGPSATPGGKWQKALLHEFGTRRMPRRGLLAGDPQAGTLGAQDRRDILDEISDYLAQLL